MATTCGALPINMTWEQMRPYRNPDGDVVFRCIECDTERKVLEGPQTECSNCGTWQTLKVETGFP